MLHSSISLYGIKIFVGKNRATEIAENTFYCSGFSGVTVSEREEELVLADTDLWSESEVLEDQLRQLDKRGIDLRSVMWSLGETDD